MDTLTWQSSAHPGTLAWPGAICWEHKPAPGKVTSDALGKALPWS